MLFKKYSFILLILLTGFNFYAQKSPVAVSSSDFNYVINGIDGNNGLTVCYNPVNKLYYCVFAGNSEFPLEVFNRSGETLYSTTAKIDMRGLWYNQDLNCLEGTRFTGGAFKIYFDGNGNPANPVFQSGNEFIAPYEQCQVVCNVAKKEKYAYYEGTIYVYDNISNKLKKKLRVKKCPVAFTNLNPYSMGFTGYKNYEFVLYDFSHQQVLFFNAKAHFTAVIKLPYDTPDASSFRFGYANNRVFIYDADNRTWYSYRVFSSDSGE